MTDSTGAEEQRVSPIHDPHRLYSPDPSTAAEADLELRASEQAREYIDRKHTGKKPYESKAKAKYIARRTSATFGGRPKEPYRCPVCDKWHVGEAL